MLSMLSAQVPPALLPALTAGPPPLPDGFRAHLVRSQCLRHELKCLAVWDHVGMGTG